jgi:predicted MFS family arabinose efflux permease
VTSAAAETERLVEAPALPPLHRQPLFVRFWAARTVSAFGDQVSALAIPLTAVLVLHASAFQVGLLTAMAWAPELFFALPAGVWIDARPRRRRIMIVTDILRAAVLLSLPLAWWFGTLTFAHLLTVTFAVGALTVFFDLASISFTVALIDRGQYVEAQSRLSTSRSASFIGGPTIAGFLVQALGAPAALLADAFSFLCSAVMLRGTNVPEPPVEKSDDRPWTRLRGSFDHLLHDPLLRASLGCTATLNFFNFVLLSIFILFASRTLGLSAGTIGIVLGVGAFGGLVGALIAPRVGRVFGMGRAVIVGAILFPAALALFPLAHGSHLLVVLTLLAGEFLASVGVMIFDINQNTILALHVPDNLRSRVFGAYRFMNYGTRPVGALLGGVLGSAIGLRETMWIGVVGGMLGVLFLVRSPMSGIRQEDLA